MKITVISGSIGDVETDALITTVNSSGLWFGAIDSLIMRETSNNPHSIFAKHLDLYTECEGRNIPAKGSRFKNVIFVVDDLNKDLWVPIYNALDIAEHAKHATVTMPTFRLGVMLGIKEKTLEEYVLQYTKGIKEWIAVSDGDNTFLQEIKIVVYNDPKVYNLLSEAFK